MTIEARIISAFEQSFAAPPQGLAFAPGRVNLIGDHVDYNDGYVLPMPLSLGTVAAWRLRDDDRCVVAAADLSGETYKFTLGETPPKMSGWQSLIHGMIALMQQESPLANGLNLLVAGNLPRGSGLSSSASLCIAVGRAVMQATGEAGQFSPEELAKLAQQVEQQFAGVECGIMDQMAIAAGEPGKAMLLDCRNLNHTPVTLPSDWAILIVQSGISRELVDGAYNERRKQCESAARKLGQSSLRDIDPGTLDLTALDEQEAKRARHVVTEIDRTKAAARAIEGGAIAEIGLFMRASHASMRDDFEASHEEVDRLTDAYNAIIGTNGGARMTGGGFGGAIVLIFEQGESDRIIRAIHEFDGPDTARRQVMKVFN